MTKVKKKFDITKEIRNHENKYTIILVVLFIFIILFTSYCILSIDNKKLTTNNKSVNYRYSSISNSNQILTLTEKNILSDQDGLNTNKILIHIENSTNSRFDYKIVLNKDKNTTINCGCENTLEDYKYIKYSLNGKDILKLDKDYTIYKGTLKKDESKDILVNVWIDKTILDITNNYHYHGYFKTEKINQD